MKKHADTVRTPIGLPPDFAEFAQVADELKQLVGAIRGNLSGRWPVKPDMSDEYSQFGHEINNAVSNMASFCRFVKADSTNFGRYYTEMKSKVIGRLPAAYPLEDALVADAKATDGGMFKDDPNVRNLVVSELGEVARLMERAAELIEKIDPAKQVSPPRATRSFP